MTYYIPTGEDFKHLRRNKGLTQAQLAKKIGVCQSLIARIETGGIDTKLSTARKIVGALQEDD